MGDNIKLDTGFYLRRIQQMVADPRKRYDWAKGTLSAIAHKIETSGTVTQSQIHAIMNIKRSI